MRSGATRSAVKSDGATSTTIFRPRRRGIGTESSRPTDRERQGDSLAVFMWPNGL